jgi:hypothetical protein
MLVSVPDARDLVLRWTLEVRAGLFPKKFGRLLMDL